MRRFNKRKLCHRTPEEAQAQADELRAAKNTISRKFQDAKDSNQRVLDLLEQNHFHIKLYVAAGGSPRKDGEDR